MKKSLHIIFLAILILGPAGAAAMPFAPDCGMECCQTSECDAGGYYFQASSCCGGAGVTCGFNAVRFEPLLGETVPTFNSSDLSRDLSEALPGTAGFSPPSFIDHRPANSLSAVPPAKAPVYIFHASLLC